MLKRTFDITISFVLLILISPFLGVIIMVAALDTNSSGIFRQERIGQFGQIFVILKIQTIHKFKGISKIGHFFRKYKLDELPQLINVIKGDMSLVGPRPDIKGYYDTLKGSDRDLLLLKPGITGLASLVYRNEEQILAKQKNPLQYNDEVLFVDKIRLNLLYQKNYSFWLDLQILWHTVFGGFPAIIKES
uniref:sugar transferase n=1 Tax=Flavobacterium sp. TaxID=239 RepID=UPI0040492E15